MNRTVDKIPNRTQKLLAFVSQDFEEDLCSILEEHIAGLASSRTWSLGPPKYVNDQSDSPTLGGVLEIYSAIPKGSLSLELDRTNYQEVVSFVDSMSQLSADYELAIEFELDGTFVGSIEDGTMDTSLRDGLLDEWKKYLESQ